MSQYDDSKQAWKLLRIKADGGKNWVRHGWVPLRYAGGMRHLLHKIAAFEECGDFDWNALVRRYPRGREYIELYQDGFWSQYVYMCNVRKNATLELNAGLANNLRSPTLDTWMLREWKDASTPTAWEAIPTRDFDDLGDPTKSGNCNPFHFQLL